MLIVTNEIQPTLQFEKWESTKENFEKYHNKEVVTVQRGLNVIGTFVHLYDEDDNDWYKIVEARTGEEYRDEILFIALDTIGLNKQIKCL